MIAKANIDRIDFGLKQITNDHSHVVFTKEDNMISKLVPARSRLKNQSNV